MPAPNSELLTLTPDAIISLYELDLRPLGNNESIYFCNWKDTEGVSIKFQGFTYNAAPLEVEGFELNGAGRSPTPTMRFGNTFGIITALVLPYDDLIGAKLIRKRTLTKYLDGKPTANPTMEFLADHYVINRKVSENALVITFELRKSLGFGMNVKLPNRYLFKNLCAWEYRSAECGYTGGAVADKYDMPTGIPNLDMCSHTVAGCKFRFGEYAQLPFGGFPGLDDA